MSAPTDAFGRPPKIAYWSRSEFLAARELQYEATIKRWNEEGRPSNWHIIAPPDSIYCDDCDARIMGLDINVVRYGRRAVCDRCFDKYLPGGPYDA